MQSCLLFEKAWKKEKNKRKTEKKAEKKIDEHTFCLAFANDLCKLTKANNYSQANI